MCIVFYNLLYLSSLGILHIIFFDLIYVFTYLLYNDTYYVVILFSSIIFVVDCDWLFICSIISCMCCVWENIQTEIDHVDYLPSKTQWTARIQSIW